MFFSLTHSFAHPAFLSLSLSPRSLVVPTLVLCTFAYHFCVCFRSFRFLTVFHSVYFQRVCVHSLSLFFSFFSGRISFFFTMTVCTRSCICRAMRQFISFCVYMIFNDGSSLTGRRRESGEPESGKSDVYDERGRRRDRFPCRALLPALLSHCLNSQLSSTCKELHACCR